MSVQVVPLEVTSLKNACVQQLEALILSGELKINEKLPSERDLAAKLQISRPVLHEALVDLAAKGLVRIEARRGVFVNDYRTHGSCALLSSLLAFHENKLDTNFENSLLEMRFLVEVETAGLAAERSTAKSRKPLAEIISKEASYQQLTLIELVELDFAFHLQIAILSENRMYPLILNSFKGVYTHFTRAFYRQYHNSPILADVFAFHRDLYTAIDMQHAQEARLVMKAMLAHGERFLKGEMS
jgi:DNA-binding FadR family transcriptional regulator